MIKIVSEIDNEKWSKFVLMHPKGNIFQTPEMYEIYKETKNYEPIFIAAIDENNTILGLLLAVIQKEHKGILGKFSSRSIITGGPLVNNDNLKVIDLLLKDYGKKISGKAIYSQVRNMFDQINLKEVFERNNYKYEAHLDILINLNIDKLELTSKIQKGKRRNFTKSKNKGAKFKEIIDLNEFKNGLKLIELTYKRVKLPMPDVTFFINAFEKFSNLGFIKSYGIYKENDLIAFRIALIYKKKVYDWFAGDNEEYRSMYSNDYLIYNILLNGVECNYHTFDFGGAGKPNVPYGVRDHKMKFGGDLVEYGRFEIIHKPLYMSLGKIALKLYKKIK